MFNYDFFYIVHINHFQHFNFRYNLNFQRYFVIPLSHINASPKNINLTIRYRTTNDKLSNNIFHIIKTSLERII